MILEIAVSNMEAALLAEKAGADRIELCDNLKEGGTTPSHAYIQYAVQHLSIPVFPIIRPRGGDFLYTNAEFEMMLGDILVCKNLGCAGVVIGFLHKNGTVDKERTAILVKAAGNMEVTFHRAFDRTKDAFEALEAVIETGCTRILSSGLSQHVDAGIELLSALVKKAANRIILMPGSGVRSNNLEHLIAVTNAKEFHSSAAINCNSLMQYKNPNFPETDGNYNMVDPLEITLQKEILNRFSNKAIR
jgi:copper homeostasis protein